MRLKRLISAFIACAMLVTFMPMQAFAADDLPEVAEYYESFDEESPMEIGARATRSETIELGESKTLVGKLGGFDKWDTSDPDVIEIDWSWGVHTAKITALQVSDDPIIITHTYGLYGFAKEEQWEITVTSPSAKFFVLKAAGNEPESGADQGQDNYYPYADDTIEVDGITYDETTGLPGFLTEKGYELLQDNDGEYFALGGETPIDDKLVIEPGQKFMKALRDVAGLSDKQKIVWYVMKDQKDGYHVDGYVSNIPVTVTYKTGYPEASGIENKTFKDTDAFTGSYKLLSPEACEFSPSGYTFTGWKLENSETDKTYEPNTSFELTKAETFVAQWEKDEESDGSTAAYFYVLKPDFSGDPSTATPENFYYVGQGSIENPHAGEADGQQYTKPQEPVTDLPGDIAAKLENIVWYRVGQANGANSNGGTPVVSDGITTWHVDGYLTAPLTVQAVDENNSMLGVTDWPRSESVRVGNEYTVVVGKDNNATIEVPQTITVDGQHYAYDAPKQDEQNGAPLSGKMQLNGATVKIPYAPDNNEDGTPDKYQVFVKYVSADEKKGAVLGSDQVITFEDEKEIGDVTTSQVSAQPNAGFEFDKWTVDYLTETPLSDSCLLKPQNFVDVPGGTTITFTAHFKSETQPYQLTFDANSGLINDKESFTLDLYADDLKTDKLLYAPKLPDHVSMTAPEGAVFAYWSQKDTNGQIFERGEDQLPDMCKLVSFKGTWAVTVYAVWSTDVNDNGKPDITEEKYTLQYNANGGTGVPNNRAGLLLNQLVTLDEGATMHHDDVDGKAVVFVGWSTNQENKIFGKNDAAPEIVSKVTIKANEFLINTVYAVWGYDENNDGKPDVTEGQYLVSYAWTGAPEGVPLPAGKRYLAYTDVPVESPYTKDTVVKGVQDGVKGFYTFSGWSTQDVTITADNQFRMPEKDVTLNGTWTFTKDENGDKIPDERQIFVNYRSNAERYGTVSAEAANKVFTFTEEEIAAAKENGDKLSVRKLHAQATETSDGDFDRWTTSADFGTLFPVRSATLDVEVTFTVDQLGETLEVVANFDRETGGGGAHHPDARDDDDDDNDRDDEDDTEESIDEEVPLAETPWLNTEDHYAYIIGYSEDGTVRPNANISRAEVATIFFRLLTDEARDQFWMTSNNFSDVLPNDWYNNAVSTMVNMGIIQGYEDGTFRPNANITRAEFAAIAARFMSSGYDVEEDLFTDIANHWARESINDAAMAGWINGYEDGAFRPDAAITRAEAVTLVNNVLQRKPDADHMFDSMIKWPDNPEGTWYYEAIQEATNSHDYDLFEDAEYETWTALRENRDWAALEKDWVNTHRTGGEVA